MPNNRIGYLSGFWEKERGSYSFKAAKIAALWQKAFRFYFNW